MPIKSALILLAVSALRAQQPSPNLDQIIARLDLLESQNRKLMEEVQALRRELSPAATPLAERVEILEHRTEEAAQTKVEASQRFPLAVTGMALFNVYANGRNNGGLQDPLIASATPSPSNSGATFRQTVIGLRFNGPETFLGGRVTGAVDFDLWGGDSTSLNHLIRLRTATIRLDWKNTSISVGQDKPLIAPRDPDSLAQVAFSPLTGAGNPWLWQPQARVEQRFAITENSGIRLQGSLYQTRELYGNLPANYQSAIAPSRPGWESRAEYWKKWNDSRRFELASGFHESTTHYNGESLPSRAYSFDWLLAPLPHWEITGAFYQGQNLTNIGAGGPGLSLLPGNELLAVHQTAGWVQTSWQILPRLKFNAFSGEQANRASDLANAALHRNLAWGGNFMYHLAPNVITSFEALQLRTDYLNTGVRLHNHYDIALAYLF